MSDLVLNEKNTFLPKEKTSEYLGWKAPETTTPHLIQNPSKSDPSSWFIDYINYISSATHPNPGNPQATSISISSLHLDPTPLTPAVMKLLHRSPQSVGAWLITITWLVVSTHLKNMIVKMGSSSPGRGEHKKYLSCHHLVTMVIVFVGPWDHKDRVELPFIWRPMILGSIQPLVFQGCNN